MSNKISKSSFIFIVLTYLFVFQELVETIFPFFQYFDELYAFSLIFLLLKKDTRLFLKNKLKKSIFLRKSLYCIAALLFIGTIASLHFSYQSFSTCLYDVVNILKFPLAVLATSVYFRKLNLQKDKIIIKKNIRFITAIFIILSILNYIFIFWPSTTRYGIMSNQLFFTHPGKLSVVCTYLSVINFLISKKPLNGTHFTISLLILSTLRAKGIGFIILSTIFFFISEKTTKKYSYKSILLVGIIAAIAASSQIQTYYINSNSARLVLTDTSIQVANDHFPLGAGFSTFGSYGSTIDYSPIYHNYGMSTIYGFAENNTSYAMDTFWPMIIAEFGYIGCVFYIGYALLLLLDIQNVDNFSKNKKLYVAKIVCFAYLIISSTSETAFVNPMAVTLAVIIGLNYNQLENRQ